ncbi:MAG: histidinol dehydrogenase [Lachnospiraceae bacterium]|nr:histidinol dehydrogenase [Lachnospiraceae bacterium]
MIRIMEYGKLPAEQIFARATEEKSAEIEKIVYDIIEDVKANGDAAILAYAKKFDKADLESVEVSEAEIDEAFEIIDDDFIAILEEAAANIRYFHEKQVRNSFVLNAKDGIILGQKITPIDKVGIYVPGGRAVYPSTVLMDSIPAKIAGCGEICMTTPPNAEGKINPTILIAARIAGVDRIFKTGGAQAVAGLAYGTETIPKVDKIVGPGNAFVAEAKRQVFGRVAIDMIAGPSEIMVIADGKSDPMQVAADMLSQAEHDPDASAVLVTDSYELAEKVSAELERQLATLPKEAIARASIETNGKIIVAENLDDVFEVANQIAPEHLELCFDDPFAYLDKVRNAGSIFMGRNCPEALGDYFAGPNHTLPTAGTARFSSPLSVDDFIKKSQFTYYTRDALEKVYKKIATFADFEELRGHGRSVEARFEEV